MGQRLTVRHEAFVRLYLANGGNGAAAYRETARLFPKKPLVNMKGAPVIAYRILRLPQVQQRVKELQHIMATKADITVDKILTDYQQALELAKSQAKPADIVNAASAQAKLVGLLRERTEVGTPGSFDGAQSLEEVIAMAAEQGGPEVEDALRKAFGLPGSTKAPKTSPAASLSEMGFDDFDPDKSTLN